MRWIRQPRENPDEPRLELAITEEYEFTVWPDGKWLAYSVPTFQYVGSGKVATSSLAKEVCSRFEARYTHKFVPGFMAEIQDFGSLAQR